MGSMPNLRKQKRITVIDFVCPFHVTACRRASAKSRGFFLCATPFMAGMLDSTSFRLITTP